MLKSPCERRCESRCVGCHSSCERYLEYADVIGTARDRRNKFKETEDMLYGVRRRRR